MKHHLNVSKSKRGSDEGLRMFFFFFECMIRNKKINDFYCNARLGQEIRNNNQTPENTIDTSDYGRIREFIMSYYIFLFKMHHMS